MAYSDNQKKRKETPSEWQQPKEINKGGNEYPNYFIWQTRTGNIPLRVDDTKGNESVAIAHRSGSGIQFLPNGGTQFISNYGHTQITYGQSRKIVTGAQDETVHGDSSVRTKGTRRITNEKDVEESTAGKVVSTAQSYNMSAGKHFDIASQSAAFKTKNGITMDSGDGPISLTGKGSTTLESQGGGSVGISSSQGSAVVQGLIAVAVKGNEVHIKGGGAEVVLSDGKVFINSGVAKDPKDVWKAQSTPTDSNTGLG